MRLKRFCAAALLGFFLAYGCSARADELSRPFRVLNGISLVDTFQTQTWLHGRRYPCANGANAFFLPNRQPPGATCVAVELDPLAKPFVGNLGRNLTATIVTNVAVELAVRAIFRHAKKQAATALYVVDGAYASGILIPNQLIIEAQR